MTTKLLTLIALSLAVFHASAQDLTPERKIVGHEVRSQRDPAVSIGLPSEATYVGAHRWTLYGIADCEIHVFVEADDKKRVQRLYWIQFEGYVPSNPDARYDYSKNAMTELGGRPFHVQAGAGENNQTPRAGSDQEQVYRLLSERGYSLPNTSISVRLVNVFAQNRKELMFIYAEDMQPTGLTPADAEKNPQWPAIEARVIDAAKKRLSIRWADAVPAR